MSIYKKFRKKVIEECQDYKKLLDKQKGSAKLVREIYLVDHIINILNEKP
jgi:hypothetical protein